MPPTPPLEHQEWSALCDLLGARVTDAAAFAAAQVGLVRLQHRFATSGVRSFGWTELPDDWGISGKNAHKRISKWQKSDLWWPFWDALIALRAGQAVAERPSAQQSKGPADPIVALLDEAHRAYRYFNARFTGNTLPASIVITLERPQQPGSQMLGYHSRAPLHTPAGQHHHLALLPERLHNPDAALECLLHEMAHLRNWTLGLEDTDPKTGYHTLDFKVSAELFGLQCAARCPRKGYAHTQLAPRGKEAIAQLRPVASAYRFG